MSERNPCVTADGCWPWAAVPLQVAAGKRGAAPLPASRDPQEFRGVKESLICASKKINEMVFRVIHHVNHAAVTPVPLAFLVTFGMPFYYPHVPFFFQCPEQMTRGNHPDKLRD